MAPGRRTSLAIFVPAAVVTLGLSAIGAQLATSTSQPGVLLLAHGGQQAWDENVRAIAASVDRTVPVEVAFGMATRANIQAAIDRLIARRVTAIVAVPLFVSSHSAVMTSTEYLLGLRREMPPELIQFASMSDATSASHDHQHRKPAEDGTVPVRSPVPITMTRALDAHPVVSAIISTRVASISENRADEAVILVAHGPVDDASNAHWLANLRKVAEAVRRQSGHEVVDAITVRDDAPAAIRDAATAELRALVQRRSAGARVLIVPVLLSYGGIEEGLRRRLAGLSFTMSPHGLAPDDRLAAWVLEAAGLSRASSR